MSVNPNSEVDTTEAPARIGENSLTQGDRLNPFAGTLRDTYGPEYNMNILPKVASLGGSDHLSQLGFPSAAGLLDLNSEGNTKFAALPGDRVEPVPSKELKPPALSDDGKKQLGEIANGLARGNHQPLNDALKTIRDNPGTPEADEARKVLKNLEININRLSTGASAKYNENNNEFHIEAKKENGDVSHMTASPDGTKLKEGLSMEEFTKDLNDRFEGPEEPPLSQTADDVVKEVFDEGLKEGQLEPLIDELKGLQDLEDLDGNEEEAREVKRGLEVVADNLNRSDLDGNPLVSADFDKHSNSFTITLHGKDGKDQTLRIDKHGKESLPREQLRQFMDELKRRLNDERARV